MINRFTRRKAEELIFGANGGSHFEFQNVGGFIDIEPEPISMHIYGTYVDLPTAEKCLEMLRKNSGEQR